MSTRYEYPREPSYYPPPRRASTAPSSRYTSDYAPTRSSRSNYAPSSYYDDDYPPPRRSSRAYPSQGSRQDYGDYDDYEYEYGDGDYSQADNAHADCDNGSCKAIEKEYGGFGWTEAISLAAMAGLALFNFDSAFDKHRKKSEQRAKDRELDAIKSRNRSQRKKSRSSSGRSESKINKDDTSKGSQSRSRRKSEKRDWDSELDDDEGEHARRKEMERRRGKSRHSRQSGYRTHSEAAKSEGRSESW